MAVIEESLDKNFVTSWKIIKLIFPAKIIQSQWQHTYRDCLKYSQEYRRKYSKKTKELVSRLLDLLPHINKPGNYIILLKLLFTYKHVTFDTNSLKRHRVLYLAFI